MKKYLLFPAHYRSRQGNFRVYTDNWGRRSYHLIVNGWHLSWSHTYFESPYIHPFTPYWSCLVFPVNKQDQFPEEVSQAIIHNTRGENTFKVYLPLLRILRRHPPVVDPERGLLPKITRSEVEYLVRNQPTNFISILYRRGELEKHYRVLGTIQVTA